MEGKSHLCKNRKNLENDLGKNTRNEMVEICKDGL